MVVCKFFLEGRCRFGDSCKNEHPRNNNNSNRFAPLSNAPSGQRGRSGAFGGQSGRDEFGVTVENIELDLKDGDKKGERPIWPFSAYAPGKDAPRQLLEGPIEQSFEEMRVQYYLAQASNQPQQYVNQEQALLQQVNQQVQSILNNVENAKRYIIDGQDEHPNRNDMTMKASVDFPWINKPTLGGQQQAVSTSQPSGAFGAPSTIASTGGFGQPSGLGAQRPAFGAPTAPASGFGQASALGGGGGFGRPSALGGSGGGFGQPSSLGSSNPFGGAQQTSAFGQPSQPGGTGQPAQPAFGQSAFGAASKPAFGAPSQPSAFGQPSQPGQSAFGQPSQPAQSAFGQPSQPAQSAFGQPSQPNGQPQQQTGGFGQASGLGSRPNPFATTAQNQTQNQQPASNPFGGAAQTNNNNPFGSASQNTQAPTSGNPFAARPAATTTQTPSNNPFGRPSSFGASAPSQPSAPSTAPSTAPFGTSWRATTFHNQPIIRSDKGTPCIQDRSGRLDRVWFPDGPISAEGAANPEAFHDREAPAEVYEGPLGETLRGLYEFVRTQGTFKDGIMPEIPPRGEWVDWDL